MGHPFTFIAIKTFSYHSCTSQRARALTTRKSWKVSVSAQLQNNEIFAGPIKAGMTNVGKAVSHSPVARNRPAPTKRFSNNLSNLDNLITSFLPFVKYTNPQFRYHA
jgi:hypothetical protein